MLQLNLDPHSPESQTAAGNHSGVRDEVYCRAPMTAYASDSTGPFQLRNNGTFLQTILG
jgi:hypothetical protein